MEAVTSMVRTGRVLDTVMKSLSASRPKAMEESEGKEPAPETQVVQSAEQMAL